MPSYSVIFITRKPFGILEATAGQNWELAQKTLKEMKKRMNAYFVETVDDHATVWGVSGQIKKQILAHPLEKWIDLGPLESDDIKEQVTSYSKVLGRQLIFIVNGLVSKTV